MDIKQLKFLIALDETRHFGQAAARCHITQPTLSMRLRSLEEELDLPLVNPGQKVRFVFDGFPAIVFSGWPGSSYGTFGGIVTAVEKSVSENGRFRVLVTEDPNDRKWPAQLSMGTGAEGIMLLKEVKIYYELWRNINGFPPQYYTPAKEKKISE